MVNEDELNIMREGVNQPNTSKEQIEQLGETEQHLDLEQIEQLYGEGIHSTAAVTGNINLPPEIQEFSDQL
jgi:hypothetical protein